MADVGAAGRTVWDGVYTAAQAQRGEQTAISKCFWCHSANEWTYSAFVPAWAGRPILELFDLLFGTMPYDAPGSLTRAEYTDIVSYMLSINEIPPGESELPTDEGGLAEITFTRP